MDARTFPDFRRGMGFGGWLTNYKRFNVLPQEWRTRLTVGDFEHFRSYLSEADAENVAAMGFDHVRVGFDQIVLEERPGVYREEILDLLDRFCGWFESRGLGVVLNLHKAVGNYCDIHEENALLDDPALQDRFVALWEAVDRRFAHRPAVAFELLNEVLDVPPEKWLALARRTVAALRRIDPGRWIVVGPTCWNNPWALRALDPFDDPRVAYAFHMYEPSAFTHQRGVLQPAHCFYNRDMPYPGDPERYRDHARETGRDPRRFDGFAEIGRDFLADVLRDAFDWKAAHPGRILWCGEFGTIRHAKPAWREAWMRDVTSLLREHGVPWCVWNYLSTPNDGNRFSLVDDDTRRILSPALLRACLGEG